MIKHKPVNSKTSDDVNFQELKMMFEFLEKNSRGQDEIIADIKNLLRPIEERSLLLHIQSALASIAYRDVAEILEGVASPMRQMVYLVDLYYATEKRTNKTSIDKNTWKRLVTLLNEVEMSYFFTISGYEEKADAAQKEKSVSLAMFIQAYSNARYAYDEQVLERIQRHFAPFEGMIMKEFGFTPNEIVEFLIHVENLYNQKLTDCAKQWATYRRDGSQWRELTRFFEAKGIPYYKWAEQPELKDVVEFLRELGYVFVQSQSKLYDIDIPHDKVSAILKFLTYQKDMVGQKSIYYTEQREYTLRPFIRLDEDYLCSIMKFSAEAVYDRLNEFLLSSQKKDKYIASKSKAVEDKAVEVMNKLFDGKGKCFTGYSIELNTEQDVLFVYDGYCFVIEVKDYAQRSPRINPYQSYARINDDFKRSIQKGFEQCRRVEKALMGTEDVIIYDSPKCDRVAGVIKSEEVKDCFTIVITRDSYGLIQTDLSNLLKKEADEHYPWSVGIDDLEALVLLLRRLKGNYAADEFSEYLDFRERYHGHLLCFDELEMCGYYFVNKNDFMYYADDENYFTTDMKMSQIFDAHYACGLGFNNELNMDAKKDMPLPSYEKNFKVRKMPTLGMI